MSRDHQHERAALARRRTLDLHHRRTWEPPPPRYVVGSVTGYPITEKAAVGSTLRASTEWYVYDTDYCDRIVGVFPARPLYVRIGHFLLTAERRARALADELNRAEAAEALRADEAEAVQMRAIRPPGALSSRRGGDLDLSSEKPTPPSRRHGQHHQGRDAT